MYSSKNSIKNSYLNVYYIFKFLMNLVNWKCDIPSGTTQAYFYSTILHHKVSSSGTTQGNFLLNNCAPKHALLLHYKKFERFWQLENGAFVVVHQTCTHSSMAILWMDITSNFCGHVNVCTLPPMSILLKANTKVYYTLIHVFIA
jgi:hypothetical protein